MICLHVPQSQLSMETISILFATTQIAAQNIPLHVFFSVHWGLPLVLSNRDMNNSDVIDWTMPPQSYQVFIPGTCKYSLAWKKGLGRYDQVKHLEMRKFSWIT